MKSIIFLAIFIFGLATLATALPRSEKSPYILNGRRALPEEFPFAAGVMLNRPQTPGWCSGTLISRNFVLTAAKCLVNTPSVTIYLGASFVNSPIQVIPGESLTIHPAFDPSSEENDIGLIKLLMPANISHPEIGVARLPSRAQKGNSFSGRLTTTYGWGYQGVRGPTPADYLHTVNETTITNLACLSRFPAYITSSNICTSTGDGTPCDNDEGGALLLFDDDGLLTHIGTHSYTFSGGCSWGWPAVYTRTTSYLTWIEENSDVVIRDV